MGQQQGRYGFSASSSTGLAILCSALAHYFSVRQAELLTELCSWVIFPVLVIGLRSKKIGLVSSSSLPWKRNANGTSSRSLWSVAICLAVTSWYKAEFGSIYLMPILPPLLLCAEHLTWKDGQLPSLGRSFHQGRNWISIIVAVMLTFELLRWNYTNLGWSLLPIAALLFVYVSITPGTRSNHDIHDASLTDIDSDIFCLAFCVSSILGVLLGVQLLRLGFPDTTIMALLQCSLAKGVSWYFMIQTVRQTPWSIVPSIEIFSIIFAHSLLPGSQLLFHIPASLLAVGQILDVLPGQHTSVPKLLLLVFLCYSIQYTVLIAIKFGATSTVDSSMQHPIDRLMQNAREDFDKLIERQSHNFASAEAEYRRRYGMDPPLGFEAWYNYALVKQAPIIDNFDIIHNSITPLSKLSGKQVIEAIDAVLKLPEHDLWRCSFQSSTGRTGCTHPSRTNDRNIGSLFDKILGDLKGQLPDVEFLVNHLDEPRVLFPAVSTMGNGLQNPTFTIEDLSERPIWDVITKDCPQQLASNTHLHRDTLGVLSFRLLANQSSAFDLCQHPEYRSMHGLFISPTSFKPIHGLIPILSTGAPSTMGDLLFPSPAYTESSFKFQEFNDVEWEEKQNQLYWAGSTTGGYAGDKTPWWHFHRQRFVTFVSSLRGKHRAATVEGQNVRSGFLNYMKSIFPNHSSFKVAFTGILHCSSAQCAAEATLYTPKPWAHKDHVFRSTLAFDLDGNGISGRVYKLLASRSVPFKQTVLREWHDDRLVPWVHYVPVSLGMGELEDLVDYFAGTSTGRKKAREIAEAGREWYFRALRKEDRSVYVYRLMLEIARLRDPERLAN